MKLESLCYFFSKTLKFKFPAETSQKEEIIYILKKMQEAKNTQKK